MSVQIRKSLSYGKQRIMFIIFAFVMLHLCTFVLNPYAKFWSEYFNRPGAEIIMEWILSLIFLVAIYESSIQINIIFEKHVSWTGQPARRLILQTLVNTAVAFLIIFAKLCLFDLYYHFDHAFKPNSEDSIGKWNYIVACLVISIMINCVNTLNYLIYSLRISAKEATDHQLVAAEFKQAATEAELLALKLQIDPHFVFNNLSVLSELILEDPQLGYRYTENLSRVYRYLLINSKKNLITLESELNFANSYIFLINNRFGKGVTFEINIEQKYLHLYLPPMTMQILLENALQHNKTLKSDPLVITVKINDRSNLVIMNNLNLLEKKSYTSQTGLNNIRKRYILISEREPIITTDETHFTVEIPLLKYEKKNINY